MKRQYTNTNIRLFSYFLGLSIMGALVFQCPVLYRTGVAIPFIDGLFTTVSALCVTGLSTVDMKVFSPLGFVAILFFIEAGGLGIVTFFAIYLAFPSKKVSLINRRIVKDFFIDDVDVNVHRIIFRIITYTFTIQIIGAIILSLILRKFGEKHNWFYGVFLSISAFCNAGFSPYSDSLHRFSNNIPLCVIIGLLIVLGGLGFTVLSNVVEVARSRLRVKRRSKLSLHSRIVLFMTGALILSGAVLVFVSERCNAFASMDTVHAIINAFFQSITLRTAGFETISQRQFAPLLMFISVLMMAIGGSPGSMAGGLKTTTVFLALCFAFGNYNDKDDLSIFHRDISLTIVKKAVSAIIKGFCFLVVIICLMCLSEENLLRSGLFQIHDLVFEVISAFGTVGLSQGVTSSLSCVGKCFIIVTMFFGRTGVVVMALNFRGMDGLASVADYPRENVLVG